MEPAPRAQACKGESKICSNNYFRACGALRGTDTAPEFQSGNRALANEKREVSSHNHRQASGRFLEILEMMHLPRKYVGNS